MTDDMSHAEAQFVAGVVRELKNLNENQKRMEKSVNERMARIEASLDKRFGEVDRAVEAIKEWKGTVDAWKAVMKATIDPEKIDTRMTKIEDNIGTVKTKVKGFYIAVGGIVVTIFIAIAILKAMG